MLLLICTLIAVTGAIYVACDRALTANYLWSISNLAFIIHNIMITEFEMVILFTVYEVICLFGIWNLKFNTNGKIE